MDSNNKVEHTSCRHLFVRHDSAGRPRGENRAGAARPAREIRGFT